MLFSQNYMHAVDVLISAVMPFQRPAFGESRQRSSGILLWPLHSVLTISKHTYKPKLACGWIQISKGKAAVCKTTFIPALGLHSWYIPGLSTWHTFGSPGRNRLCTCQCHSSHQVESTRVGQERASCLLLGALLPAFR